MASLTRRADGSAVVQFTDRKKKRQTIHAGKKISDRNASKLKNNVESILERNEAGEPLDADTKAWLNGIPDSLHAKLVRVGLVGPREQAPEKPPGKSLGEFLDYYLAVRSDVKDRTIVALKQAGNDLTGFFGKGKPIDEITAGDAEEWRISLKPRLAETTIRKRCQKVKQFFRHAVKKGFIAENPFADLKSTNLANPKRYFFLGPSDAEKVIDSCPDAHWRMLFVLARYGGLRVPSEPAVLKWEDVNWEQNRITITSPKTEHHEGGDSRVIPLFPELRPYLEDQLELTGDTAHVLPSSIRAHSNPGTMLRKIIKRAGLKPWEKIWQNLRSTRQTELSERFPAHVVCAWIGNSEDVAKLHYLQVTDAHFAKAAAAASGDTNRDSNPPITEKSAAKSASATPRNSSKWDGDPKTPAAETPVLQGVSSDCSAFRCTSVAVEGLEPPTRGL